MKIAAFNGKNLGWKKVTDKAVVHILTKIVSQYSVVLLLEVMDTSGKAMQRLLKELNKISSNRNSPFSMTSSCMLGRDTYKERFVCFYREKDVTLEDCHQYEDVQVGDVDAFAREPFVLRFSCPSTLLKDLVLIPVHTKPDDSLKELDELHDVVDSIREKWGTDNIMILGDFNADGRYLSKKKKDTIRISSAPYHWLIDDDVDTTSSNNNDHTYDRIVVFGESMLKAIVTGSAKPFNFQREFHLTDEETLSVSDHYPVEVELKQKAARKRKAPPAKGQTHKKGPQKKKAKLVAPQKKKKAELVAPQKKKKKADPVAPQKKKKKADPVAPHKKKKADPVAPQKKKKPSNTPTKRRRLDK
ncbi:hypothetical protein CesoFtcFv8_002987 [Champsocephalus esox]|uniref:Uncharacterized protein n=1 Tax=Champsocephalus esox TaxID=159716 RepID=A0AAN8CYW3_9TELE|nr:hypothetical protein CesoFtcFv8_002987 [Champsocephalus esox]